MSVRKIILYVATACLLLAVSARYALFDYSDPLHCDAAVGYGGQWLESPGNYKSTTGTFRRWQPERCMLEEYKDDSIHDCLQARSGGKALFVGDSRTRQIFWSTAFKLDEAAAQQATDEFGSGQSDATVKSGETVLNFVWDPFLNETQWYEPSENAPPFLVVGGGLWYALAFRESEEANSEFQKTMNQNLESFSKKWTIPSDGPESQHISRERPFVVPVLPPYYDWLDARHRRMNAGQIDPMNMYLQNSTSSYDIDLATSYLSMVQSSLGATYEKSGLHVSWEVSEIQSDILLNLRCNKAERKYPIDGTCCTSYPVYWAQPLLGILGLVFLTVTISVELYSRWKNARHGALETALTLLWASVIVWVTLLYCYLADRTHLFDKLHKFYSHVDISIFGVLTLLIGLSTLRKYNGSPSCAEKSDSDEEDPTLFQNQISNQFQEWKGWMQILIMASDHTAASRYLWVYKSLRLLIGAYLFIVSYEYTIYFHKEKNFGYKRVVAVLLRLNILSILLPWMMNTDYLFYYFAPIISYWFLIIYAIMVFKKDWNHKIHLFLLKITISCTFTTLLHWTNLAKVFEPVFAIVNTIFGSDWNAREWAIRCGLNGFIVYIGMVAAVVLSETHDPLQEKLNSTLSAAINQKWLPHLKKTLMLLLATASLSLYMFIAVPIPWKIDYNNIHPFISPLAILPIFYLRNCTTTLRTFYSSGHVWLGGFWLETLTLQNHIWLAADRKGVLSLGLFGQGGALSSVSVSVLGNLEVGRWLDCALTGVVFVLFSAQAASAVETVTEIVVDALPENIALGSLGMNRKGMWRRAGSDDSGDAEVDAFLP